MTKQKIPLFTRNISSPDLARHLGVSRNYLQGIVENFGLKKAGKGYLAADVFRKVHGIEPMLLAATLAKLKARYSGIVESDDGPHTVWLYDEFADVTDLAETLWDDGLVPVTNFAAEYGYAHDVFRKKLKAGKIEKLPPVSPIALTTNLVMYRPLDVFLWRRHDIALDLPRAAVPAGGRRAPSPVTTRISHRSTASYPAKPTDTVFSAAVAATEEKSDVRAASAHSADLLHKPRT